MSMVYTCTLTYFNAASENNQEKFPSPSKNDRFSQPLDKMGLWGSGKKKTRVKTPQNADLNDDEKGREEKKKLTSRRLSFVNCLS